MSCSVSSETKPDRVPVSVVVPTYNRAALITRALDSILSQTKPPQEIVVIDDGSVDDTEGVVRERYGEKVNYVRQSNAGVAAARNAGVRAATAEFVAFLDSDDRWMPTKLERQFPTTAESGVVLSATDWRWDNQKAGSEFTRIGSVDHGSVCIQAKPLTYLARPRGHGILMQTCICRREALLEAGCFDKNFRIAEDNDLLFRLAERGQFALVGGVLMERCSDGGVAHLTDVRSVEWKMENLSYMLAIMERSLKRTKDGVSRTVLRRRLSVLQVELAKLIAYTGDTTGARAMCLSHLRHPSLSKTTVLALAGLIAPTVLAGRVR